VRASWFAGPVMSSLLFPNPIVPVFFVYGLAFFTMGLVVAYEAAAHIADPQMSRAMGWLAFFGLVHGSHEWFEMFIIMGEQQAAVSGSVPLETLRVVALAISFLALCSYGLEMLHRDVSRMGVRWGGVGILLVYGIGTFLIARRFAPNTFDVLHAVDSWTRYSLGIGGGLLAMAGMLDGARDYWQRDSRAVARGWLTTALALGLYGLLGQSAPTPSLLWPATIYNSTVFQATFGFPVQLLRAGFAVIASIGLLLALRALEYERQRLMAYMRDKAQQELERREMLQKELTRHIIAAQEDERARIARELHDQTGQTLTALNYRVAALQAGQPVDRATLDDLRGLAEGSLADLRQLVTDLRPAQLDDLGLVATLHWLADQMNRRFRLGVDVQVEGKRRRLPGEIETVLFRVTQEALSNIARHAGVDEAQVKLVFLPEAVRVEIVDRGMGFDVKHKLDSTLDEGPGAWGVIGMQERALAVGGRFQVISEPGQGTLVSAIIPVAGEDDHG